MSDIGQNTSGSGGGPSLNGILTPMEKRILAIMGVQNVIGNENVRIELDMGFDDSPPQPAPSSRPVTPVSDEPTPQATTGGKIQLGSSKIRTRKRKHVAVARAVDGDDTTERARPLTGPPRWALDLEERRIREEKIRRDLEERRVGIEERRLALTKVRVTLEKARLELEKQRLEEDQSWRKDILECLSKISKSLGEGME